MKGKRATDAEGANGAAAPFERNGSGCLNAGVPFFTVACQAGVAKRIGWSRTCSGHGASRLKFGTARRAVPTLGNDPFGCRFFPSFFILRDF